MEKNETRDSVYHEAEDVSSLFVYSGLLGYLERLICRMMRSLRTITPFTLLITTSSFMHYLIGKEVIRHHVNGTNCAT